MVLGRQKVAYLLRSGEKLNTKAIYAAPCFNGRAKSVADGMEKSYNEILKILDLMDIKVDVFRGSCSYLPDESTPVISEAARDLAERYAKGKAWTRVIWDVTAVAWLLNDNNRFMMSKIIPMQLPEYNNGTG